MEKYHVPKVIEHIARMINEKGTICNLTVEDLRELANVTVPFHDDLYQSSEPKPSLQQKSQFGKILYFLFYFIDFELEENLCKSS